MPNQLLSRLAKLYELVASMEEDLGLDTFSDEERAMIYAMTASTQVGTEQFQSADIKDHPLCRKISKPTFYRNLKKLVHKGVVLPAPGRKTGVYVLSDSWKPE